MPFVDTYKKAMLEFENLTNRKAQTLKNKGKEAGVKKLALLFKSGKTLEQRAVLFDQAIAAKVSVNTTPAQAKTIMKTVVETSTKFGEGLKKNREEFTKGIADVGNDPDMKAGYEVFVKRMDQMRYEVKTTTDQKAANLKEIVSGKALAGDAKVVADIRRAYLGIKGGLNESDALIKLFSARPTEDNAYELLTNTKGPRSLGVGVTAWKRLVTQNPDLAGRLSRAGGGDPEHLLQPVYELTQNKGRAFWQAKLKIGQDGWEDRVRAEAAKLSQALAHLGRSAEVIKTLG